MGGDGTLRIDGRHFHLVQRLWLAAVAVGLLAFAGMSAEAALHAIAHHPVAAFERPSGAALGYEADDHFPGAALLYAEQATAAPAAGVTGTTALPGLPVTAAAAEAAVQANAGVVPAQPFSTGAATAVDRGRALECLAAAIYYESASEPLAGQEAVAQVILNRVRHPAFPPTICGVVYQGSERTGCQFSFACDGAMRRVPTPAGWAQAVRVAAAALAGNVYPAVGLATHYHTFAVTPAWNRTLVLTDMVGHHLFHRWKGYWGTSTAFRQSYRGGEPLPGPHGPVPVEPITLAALDVPASPAVSTPRSGHVDPALFPAADPAPSSAIQLPTAAEVLDRWKDSGTFRTTDPVTVPGRKERARPPAG